MEKNGREKPMLFTTFGCSLALFGSVWSGVWDSNVWECGPKAYALYIDFFISTSGSIR